MAETISKLVGEYVVAKDGAKVATASLCGPKKYVGLYFSAHWCPPCRSFTPKLAKFYEKVRADGGQLEIIFVSCDRDTESFNEYFKTMPWHAMEYKEDDPDSREAAMDKFGVQGIPTLVLLDGSNGQEMTRNGREEVDRDPEGKAFPWRKK